MASSPTYDGSDGGRIDLATARQWAQNFRNANPKPDEIRSHYYGRNTLDDILAQQDCTGIRVYYAINAAGSKELMVVGVDSKGNSMLPKSAGTAPGDNAIMDNSYPCPPICWPPQDL